MIHAPQPASRLLERARELLVEAGDVDALLAIAACRIALEATLKAHVDRVANTPLEAPSASLAAAVLHHHGVVTRGERNAVRRLTRVASRAIHTASATPEQAQRVFDFSTSIVERLHNR
ncbi:MAG: hypothetical protein RIC55_07940 [Pirellulaceae bacterium]